MKKLTLSLIMFSILVSVAITTKAEIMIFGSRSCGVWIDDRKKDGWPDISDGNWLAGYLSGLASYSDKDFLKNTDLASVKNWVDNYCKNNPLDSVMDAANKLATELIKREHLK